MTWNMGRFPALDSKSWSISKFLGAQDDWKESDHPRGQPENPGEFASAATGGSKPSSQPIDFRAETKALRKAGAIFHKLYPDVSKGAPSGKGIQVDVNTWALIANSPDASREDVADAKFKLEHARQFEFDDDSFKCKKGKHRYCYSNAAAAALADPNLTYVEGVAGSESGVRHAWVVDKSGKVIDPTFKKKGDIKKYVGVPIKTEYLKKHLARNLDTYGLFNSKHYLQDKPEDIVKTGLGKPLPLPEEYTKEGV